MCKPYKADRVALRWEGGRSLLSYVFVYMAEDDSAPYPLGSDPSPWMVGAEGRDRRPLTSRCITQKLPITFAHTHWPELGHVATPGCERAWEIESLHWVGVCPMKSCGFYC